MPWSKGDVEKHKSGLSDKQKEQWVSVANSVLEDCREMKQENCEAKAIRTANAAVGKAKNKSRQESDGRDSD